MNSVNVTKLYGILFYWNVRVIGVSELLIPAYSSVEIRKVASSNFGLAIRLASSSGAAFIIFRRLVSWDSGMMLMIILLPNILDTYKTFDPFLSTDVLCYSSFQWRSPWYF